MTFLLPDLFFCYPEPLVKVMSEGTDSAIWEHTGNLEETEQTPLWTLFSGG